MAELTRPRRHTDKPPELRPWLPWAECRVVEVVAYTPHGAALDPEWPQALDGVLAAAARSERLGASYGRVVDHHVERLPLAVFRWSPGMQWFYAATCAEPVDDHGDEVQWWHRRFDVEVAALVGLDLPNMFFRLPGRHRPWRMPLPVRTCRALRWWALGDPTRIAELLSHVFAVGKGRGKGNGETRHWHVTDHGPASNPTSDAAARILWRADGTPARPVPHKHWARAGCLTEPDKSWAAIRPPYWRPPQTTREQGEFARQWREVIAPWHREEVTTMAAGPATGRP